MLLERSWRQKRNRPRSLRYPPRVTKTRKFPQSEAGWYLIDETYGAWLRRYDFGGGVANTVVFRNGVELSVFSPGREMPGQAFDELDAAGNVTNIIAPNGFHTSGIREWAERYPQATIYATPRAAKRIRKVCQLTQPIEDVNELAGKLSGRLHIGVPNGAMRQPEVCAWLDVQGGAIWYVNDIVLNLPKVPPGPIGFIFGFTRSAPGLRFNAMSRLVMGRNLKKTKAWFTPRLQKAPPAIWLPGHGDIIAENAREQVEALFGLH